VPTNVHFGSKAAMCGASTHVRFTRRREGIDRAVHACPN